MALVGGRKSACCPCGLGTAVVFGSLGLLPPELL